MDMDQDHFKNFTRMSRVDFALLCELIAPRISKKDTTFRDAIPTDVRLAITLRFLASGDSYTSLQYLFKVSKQRIGVIVMETCDAIIEVLKMHIKVSFLLGYKYNLYNHTILISRKIYNAR